MEATLKFNLPEDQNEFELAAHAGDWYMTVAELDDELRNKLKYGHEFKSANKALEWTRETLLEILKDRNLTLDR